MDMEMDAATQKTLNISLATPSSLRLKTTRCDWRHAARATASAIAIEPLMSMPRVAKYLRSKERPMIYGKEVSPRVEAALSTVMVVPSLRVTVPSLPVLCLGAFTAQHGCSYWDGTAVPMASRNFAGDRGLVVGLLKGFFGISSSVLTVVYQIRPLLASSKIGPL